MRTSTFRLASQRSFRLAASALLVAALSAVCAHEARASADTFGVGDGHSGNFTVTAANTLVNSYAALTANAAVNATVLTIGTPVASTVFSANDLVLIWQVTGLAAPASGNQSTIDLSASPVGTWELARVLSTGAGTLTLTSGLLNAFAGGLSQVVRVPEYDTLTINPAGSIDPVPYAGPTGGIVAFFANSIVNNGTVRADGVGFRGGASINHASLLGCSANDGLPAAGYALKGEGLVPAAFGPTMGGRGNIANGAGGGNCLNAGGGGGGNGGTGGTGGRSYYNSDAGLPLDDNGRDVGGLGGAALTYSLLSRFTLGGGGGAGEENSSSGSSGGAGGGVIFVRAGSLVGNGTMTARGATPAQASVDGAGGGGAGGSILVRLYGVGTCGQLLATGGNGANNVVNGYGPHGPGGAGGGGRVLMQSASGSCTTDASSGIAGTQDSPFASPQGPSHGATPPTSAPGTLEPAPPGGYCSTNAQCSGATSFCNANGSCRGCQASDCSTPTAAFCPPSGTTCLPCNGDFGSNQTRACPTAGNPSCALSGANQGACGPAPDGGAPDAGDGGAGDGSANDGSANDGSANDGSANDAGDAAVGDASANDGSANDGTVADGSASDGSATDGTVADGSASDGSAGDGSASEDGGTTGSDVDATVGYGGDGGTGTGGNGPGANGATPDGEVVQGGGCDCSLASSTSSSTDTGALAALAFAMTGLLAAARRKRRR